jgi:hypothetical protein
MLVRVKKINIITGEGSVLYSRYNPVPRSEVGLGNSSRWHDVDRYNRTHLVIADIYRNEVQLVNITSGTVDWKWEAEESYAPSSGGDYVKDWTHLNDVERVRDGVIMASLRNQDTVVFINPGKGNLERLALGEDGNHSIIYEQHNPDYIPASRGGPAVLVADSENNRIIEYERVGEEWVQSWTWADNTLLWPRDADRLPNGHTLITDSRGDRVIQVDRSGSVIWKYPIENPYEAERLGTGDESAGGFSAEELQLSDRYKAGAISIIPPRVVNTVAYFAPPLLGLRGVLAFSLCGMSIVAWGCFEGYWRYW